MKIHIDRKWNGSYDIYAVEPMPSGKTFKYQISITSHVIEENTLAHNIEPTASLSYVQADRFFKAIHEAMIEARVIPKVEHANDAELRATKYHLEDMRNLALEPQTTHVQITEDKRSNGRD